MKRRCQALAGRRVVNHLMSVFHGCFARGRLARVGGGSSGKGACGRRWPGRDGGGHAWACPRFLPEGPLASRVKRDFACTFIPEGAGRCQAGFRPAVLHLRSGLQGMVD